MLGNNNKERILIIRLSAMGDVAMTVPIIKVLRAENPDLEITIMTRSFFQPFFRDIERVSFITPDFKGLHKGVVGIVRLWRDINAHGITHVADLHDVLRSKLLRVLLRLSGKKVAVIDKGRAGKRVLTRKHNKLKEQLKPTIERYRDVVVELGFKFSEPMPIRVKPLAVPEQISSIVGKKKGVWIGVAPFAQHKGKIYPIQQTDELIGMLANEYERVFVFGGGEYEKEFAETMESRHKGAISVVGRIKLGQELDLISNLDLMISMDSAAMHMASMIGVPVVSIWGGTHLYAGFYGFGQDPQNAIGLDMDCRPCSVYGNKPCMYSDYRCMTRIPVKMIANRVAAVIKEQKTNKN